MNEGEEQGEEEDDEEQDEVNDMEKKSMDNSKAEETSKAGS